MMPSAPRVWALAMKRSLFAGTNSSDRQTGAVAVALIQMVATGVTGDPTAPGSRSGGAVSRQR